jgi:predicted unusual protein kinase regulating ubiquinone biosynthesis (AarF/ABC1/UbiB family)
LEEDITKTDFIILEYLDGKFPADIADVEERQKYLKLYLIFSFVQTLFFSYHHTDLHNGNIICLKDNETGELKMGIIDFGMNIKMTNEIKKSLLFFSETIYSNVKLEEANYHKHINIFIQNKIDIKIFSIDDLKRIDTLLYTLLKDIQKGILEEAIINATFKEVGNILQINLVLNMDFVLILLSLSMTQCCINYLSNYDTNIAAEKFKECYLEIME